MANFCFVPFLPIFLKTHYFVVAAFIGAPLTKSLNRLRSVSLLLCLLLLLSGEALPNSVPNKPAHTTHNISRTPFYLFVSDVTVDAVW